jgi:hypothetical protein
VSNLDTENNGKDVYSGKIYKVLVSRVRSIYDYLSFVLIYGSQYKGPYILWIYVAVCSNMPFDVQTKK